MTQIDRWARRIIALLEIGGGAIGMVALASAPSQTGLGGKIILCCGAAYFLFGILSGLLLAESRPRGVICSQAYQFLQILNFTTPVISYLAMSGAYVGLSIKEAGFDIQAYLGTNFRFTFLRGDSPWSVGINLLAIVAFVWLQQRGRRAT